MAVAAKEALETVGLPEARINLAHAAISLALARKDRGVYEAIEAAILEVRETGALPIPQALLHQGHAKSLLPEGVKERVYFRPRGKPDTQ